MRLSTGTRLGAYEIIDALDKAHRHGVVHRDLKPGNIIIKGTHMEAMGAGATSITLAAAAIGNAIFDGTGARLREVPFTRDRVKAALAARTNASLG